MVILKKQAKTRSDKQIKIALAYLDRTSLNVFKNKFILLLSVCAGLRAKEIANLELPMITNAEG